MQYTDSPDFLTHVPTGQRMHQDDQPVPTVVSARDLNQVIWSLMALVNRAGVAPAAFDPDLLASYTRLQEALDTTDGRASVNKWGAPRDGVADDAAAVAAAQAAAGLAWLPPGWNYKVGGDTFPGGNVWIGGESFAGQGVVNVRRTTTSTKDAIHATHYGSGTGYAVHGISYATTGSGLGGASWGTGSGVVGNKRGDGAGAAGNGVSGSRLESGDGSGLYGYKTGAGLGNGLYAINDGAGAGAGAVAWRQAGGAGEGLLAMRSNSGTGAAVRALRDGAGSGDALQAECDTTAAGQAVTGVRKLSGVTQSIGYCGYHDVATGTSAGVYGAAFAGSTQWGGLFDGAVRISGVTTLGGGAVSLVDGTGNLGSASKRFNTVYATVGSINTSCRTQKTDIAELTPALRAVGARLRGMVRSFRYRSAVAEKGPAARVHIGWIAQEVHQAFAAEGLDASDYGMWCEDQITVEVQVVDRVEAYEEPVTEIREAPFERIETRDGRPVLVSGTEPREVPVVRMVPLTDESGDLVKRPVPVLDAKGKPVLDANGDPETTLETVEVPVPVTRAATRTIYKTEVRDLGARQGVRMDQVLALALATV